MTMDALYATNVPSQSPASNGDPLTLDTTQLTEGTSITHTGGASDINITESGVYLISYSTVATNTTGAGTASVSLRKTARQSRVALPRRRLRPPRTRRPWRQLSSSA